MTGDSVNVLLDRAYNILHGLEDSLEDWRDAVKLLETASNLGSPEAMSALGDFYRSGEFTKKSLDKAVGYYKKSASLNFLPAYVSLFLIYRNEFHDDDNALKMFRILTRDIENGKIKIPLSADECLQIEIMASSLIFNFIGRFDEYKLYQLYPQIVFGIIVLENYVKDGKIKCDEFIAISVTGIVHWLGLNCMKYVDIEGNEVMGYLDKLIGISKDFSLHAGISYEYCLNVARERFPVEKYIDITELG